MNFLKRRLNKMIVAIKGRIRSLEINLEINDLKIIAFVLCLATFACGYWIGSINLNNSSDSEKFKIIFPLIITFVVVGLFTWFINDYFKVKINKKKEEYDQEILNLQQKYDQEMLNLKQKMDDLYKIQQELEFLSLYNILDKIPDHFNFRGLSEELRKLFDEDRNQFRARVKQWREESEARREAIEGLEKGFKESEPRKAPFYSLIGTVCNDALKIQDEKAHDWAKPFYDDIFFYLRAWLFCSIKYGVPVPIEPFVKKDLGEEGKERYHGKDTYISAIEYIKEIIIKNQRMDDFFPTPNSKNIVSEYLQKLIDLLNTSKKTSKNNLTALPKQSNGT